MKGMVNHRKTKMTGRKLACLKPELFERIEKILGIIMIAMILGCAIRNSEKGGVMPVNSYGCCSSAKKKQMTIRWERLVSDGKTCPRCGETENELEKAADILRKSLKPMGIEVLLEKDSLSKSEFEKNPLRSNRILFNGIPLEDYIGGKTGKSSCCDACGPVECRTLEVDKKQYETVPSEIIVKAGLIAAAQMLNENEAEKCCGEK